MSYQPAIILVRPQMGENIGAAARAMANFGLGDLRLVAPRDGWPSVEAERNASGALDGYVSVQVFERLEDAIADLHFTFATTARERDMAKAVFTPDEASAQVRERAAAGQKTGFVFGAERTGLTNEEIVLSQAFITIPTAPDFSSLNLAQAVLLMGYALQKERLTTDQTVISDLPAPASQAQMEEFFGRLEHALDSAHFFKTPEMKTKTARNIRTMFLRAEFTDQEVKTFHGILSALLKS